MKNLYFLILILITFSSCNKKTVQLPEIQNASITEVVDVSPVYMFYDEKKDSIEFNRKNMISTTNWLVNIDKRLTLKQVLPHLLYLQEKRHGDGMHKNENARNYFTCNDTIRKDLGFIDFTDLVYTETDINLIDYSISLKNVTTFLRVYNLVTIKIQSTDVEDLTTNFNELNDTFKKYFQNRNENRNIVLAFDKNLSFQNYITIKSLLSSFENESISISNEEFIY